MLRHNFVEKLAGGICQLTDYQFFGRVTKVLGLLVEVGGGIERQLSMGDRCNLMPAGIDPITCEVVGFRDGRALVMPFKPLDRVGLGCRAEVAPVQSTVSPSPAWLGRVINALG